MTKRFLLCSDPDNLTAALAAPSATVEAEYGDRVVEGSVITMAHHGPRAGEKAPCSYEFDETFEAIETVGLSHVDLDSIGGCLALLGVKPVCPGFWELAEFVDLNGAHKLSQAGATPENLQRLYAWWAWAEKHRQWPPRDGSVTDVTDYITKANTALTVILKGDAELLADGEAHRLLETKLNEESFAEINHGIVVRVGPEFCNHLYQTPTGELGFAVASFNTKNGSIVLSFADPPKGQTAREVVQKLWGPEAGGHAGIAGSPRNRRMSLVDLLKVVDEVAWQQEDAGHNPSLR